MITPERAKEVLGLSAHPLNDEEVRYRLVCDFNMAFACGTLEGTPIEEFSIPVEFKGVPYEIKAIRAAKGE